MQYIDPTETHAGQELDDRQNWSSPKTHSITSLLLLLYTFFVFYRPYELISGAAFLSSATYFIAVTTLAVYLATQIAATGSLSVSVTEIKAVAALAILALVTLPVARSPGLAWETFSDAFIKAVLIFIVLVNTIQTRRRLMWVMSISVSVGLYVSYLAISLYMKGEFNTEGYRVSVDLKGLFGNANDMALHLSTMIPIAIALGLSAKRSFVRLGYYAITILMMVALTVTFSRGGFLGLLISLIVVAWKLSRKSRLKVVAGSLLIACLFMFLAPGNYGIRILSMFVPALDPVGSSTARRELLITSLIVMLRNPWGVGIGNSPLFGAHDHGTHNAFTQVGSEIGILGLIAYLIFLINPIRKLSAIERRLVSDKDSAWMYYMSVGLQGSLIAFMVSSFFGSVAYNWYAYYLVAYAVCLRRVYQINSDGRFGAVKEKNDRGELVKEGAL